MDEQNINTQKHEVKFKYLYFKFDHLILIYPNGPKSSKLNPL